MKKIKYIVSFFMLLCCFMLSGELFQNHADTFTNGLYYFVVVSQNDDDAKYRNGLVKEIAEKHNCDVFAYEKVLNGFFSSELTVYATSSSKKKLDNICQIKPGKYLSVFSGTTSIVFKDFEECINHDINYYFFGQGDDVKLIRNEFAIETGVGGTCKSEHYESDQWLLIVVWVVFAITLLLLTWFDIKVQLKETFILISLGKSNWSIIAKNVAVDAVCLIAMSITIYSFFNKYTYTDFYIDFVKLIFICTIFLNSLLYLTLLRYDLKKALSKTNFEGVVLSNCYLIKAVSMVITIFVLMTNINLIGENGSLLVQQKNIAIFDDYEYLSVSINAPYKTEEEYIQLSSVEETVETAILNEKYKRGEAIFSVGTTSTLLISENARGLLRTISEIEHLELTKDFYLLIPKELSFDLDNLLSNVLSSINFYFKVDVEKAQYETITYRGKHNIPYFISNNNLINFKIRENPVIVLCNFSDELLLSDIDINKMKLYSPCFNNVMFKFDERDIEYFKQLYDLEEKNIKITQIDSTERNNYAWDSLFRIVILNTVVSIFMLILEFIMMTTTVRMEYTANAVEVSLKKVLGYSIFKRNKTVFLLNAFSVFIGVFTAAVASAMLRSDMLATIIAVGVVILFVEYLSVCYYVNKLEKTDVPKILKGGCL